MPVALLHAIAQLCRDCDEHKIFMIVTGLPGMSTYRPRGDSYEFNFISWSLSR